MKSSSSSFFTYLESEVESKGVAEIERICDTIYSIFTDHQKVDRITIPMLRFLEKLMSSGGISLVINNPNSDFAKKILKLIQLEIAGCKDIYKLIDGINVLCQFVQVIFFF